MPHLSIFTHDKAYSLLSLDLDDLRPDDGKRAQFNEYLEKKHWRKVAGIGTVWFATWSTPGDEDGKSTHALEDVANAAKSAGIEKYDAIVLTGGKPKKLKAP